MQKKVNYFEEKRAKVYTRSAWKRATASVEKTKINKTGKSEASI